MHSTDAAYCCICIGLSWSVCFTVGLIVTTVSPAKVAEPIEMKRCLRVRQMLGPKEPCTVLDGVHVGAT